MSWNWGAVNQIADEAVITIGIAVLIVRQFSWRSAELRLLRMPVLVIGVGIGYLVVEVSDRFHWVIADWLIVVELPLVALTGAAMGYVTRFRAVDGRLDYRLTSPGIGLWAIFIAIRVGFLLLAAASGANLADASGVILVSFGVNRLAATLVVRRRARRIEIGSGRDRSAPGVPAARRAGGVGRADRDGSADDA